MSEGSSSNRTVVNATERTEEPHTSNVDRHEDENNNQGSEDNNYEVKSNEFSAIEVVNFLLGIGAKSDKLKKVAKMGFAPFTNQYLDVGFPNKKSWLFTIIYWLIISYDYLINSEFAKKYEMASMVVDYLVEVLDQMSNICSNDKLASFVYFLKRWTFCLSSTLQELDANPKLLSQYETTIELPETLMDKAVKIAEDDIYVPKITFLFKENVEIRFSVGIYDVLKKFTEKGLFSPELYENKSYVKDNASVEEIFQKFYKAVGKFQK